MQAVGVKKQFTKLQVLSTILPKKVTDQVKPLLRKKETDFPNKDAYFQLKTKIMQIFGPAPNKGFERAMSRTLTVDPSTLGRELIDDMCSTELVGCHCAKWIYGLWLRALPSGVKQGIAGKKFDSETYQAVFQHADEIFYSTRPVLPQQSVAAMSNPLASFAECDPLDDAFSAQLPGGTNTEALIAAVAALGRGRGRGSFRGGRGGRGGARGGRGGNQNQGQNGQNSQNGNNKSQNQTQGQNKNQGQNQGQGKHPRHGTQRHADSPPFQACWRHWTYGRSAHFCQEPSSCPWKDIWVPKSNTQ